VRPSAFKKKVKILSEFYGALGQFITYRAALRNQEPQRILYLAVSSNIYDRLFTTVFIHELVEQNQVYLVIYNTEFPVG
jgi:glucose-6-phosphate 1-dehydrogenase